MSTKYDYILNRLRLEDVSGGGGGAGWDGTAETYALLPDATTSADEVWLVETASGIYLVNRHPAGLYLSDGSAWNYLGRTKETFYDSNFNIVNASDNTRRFRFDNAGIDTATQRVFTAPNKNGTIALLDDINDEYDYYVTANSWSDLVSALESGTYATVFIPDGTYTCTDDEANPLVVHANVKRISGQSREGTIIDLNGAVNTNIQNGINCHENLTVCGVTIKNHNSSTASTGAFKGSFSGDYFYSPYRITKIENCLVSELLNTSNNCVGYFNCDTVCCDTKNTAHNPPYGTGWYNCSSIIDSIALNLNNVAYNCYNVSNIAMSQDTYRVGIGLYSCLHISNAIARYIDTGFYQVSHISTCRADGCNYGFQACSSIGTSRAESCVIGFLTCTNMSYDNISNCTTNFSSCTFNKNIIDNTDNTKIATLDNSGQTTGTERTHAFQDKDGTLAHLGDEAEFDYYVTAGNWADLVQALESGTYTTVFIPNGTYTCTDNEATPLAVHANVKRISGQSREGTIIDTNSAVNTSIADFMTLAKECTVTGIHITNYGNGNSAAFKGTTLEGDSTIVNDCMVTNLLHANAIGFEDCNVDQCKVINASGVGAAGIGRGFEYCYGVTNCKTYYCSYGMIFCDGVAGNLTSRGSYGIYGCDGVAGNFVYAQTHGIYASYAVDGNRVTSCTNGINECYDVGSGNSSVSNTNNYVSCEFGAKNLRDNTDNTKIAKFDNSGQTTGTTRTIETPDYDYDMENPLIKTITGLGQTSPAHAEGMQFYDTVNKCWTNYNDIAAVGLQVGYEDHERIYNDTGIEIPDFTPYYYTGFVTDGYLHIAPADADASGVNVKARGVQGVTTHAVGIDSQGIGAIRGRINDVDTSGTPYGEVWAVGDDIYAGITPGTKTNVKPLSPSSQFRLGKVIVAHATTGILNLKIQDNSWVGITQAANQAGERTGFVLADGIAIDTAGTAVTLSVDDVALEFTIGSVAGSFQFFSVNNLFTKIGDQTVSWTDVEGDHFFYYDITGVLQHTTTWSDNFVLGPFVFVAYVYWDATNKEVILDNAVVETHGLQMDGATHLHFHTTLGAQWKSGLTLNSILADESGDVDTHAQFGVDSGVMTDEDLWHTLNSVVSTTGLRIIYLDGASGNIRQATKAGFSVFTDVDAGVGVTGRLVYNEWTGATWQLTTVPNGQFVNCLIFSLGTGDSGHRVFAVVGNNTYGNVADAEEGAKVELGNVAANLPFKERRPLGVVMFQTGVAYGNAVKARIASTAGGNDYIDVRTDALPGGVGFTPATHPSLADRDVAGAHPSTAITYDPTISGLTATDVKEAIDELATAGGGGGGMSANKLTARNLYGGI